MGKIIAFANQKGGVGKTTSAVNIAACLGALGRATLLVDIDPQGNATSGAGVNKRNLSKSTYEVLIGECHAEDAVVPTKFKGLFVLPSSITLAGAEFELVDVKDRENRLRDALSEIRERFDYIIIDCPPTLGILTIDALSACDTVVIPMQCEYYALEGLSQLMITIRKIKQLYNPSLEIAGILVTMYNGRLNLTMAVMDELKRYYADKLFTTPVVRNVKLSESPGYGMPVIYYDRYSKGSDAYISIARELASRMGDTI